MSEELGPHATPTDKPMPMRWPCTPRGVPASLKSSRPSRWRPSVISRWPIRRVSRPPVCAIAEDPSTAYDYTAKGNLVAVISNGTAILGLGNLGALASKPVMEGKAVLFKRFADVDSIDLEVGTEDVEEFINAVELSRPQLWRHQSGGHQVAGMLYH
jgi:hypothetical protein